MLLGYTDFKYIKKTTNASPKLRTIKKNKDYNHLKQLTFKSSRTDELLSFLMED